jgi:hypothetical protein
MRPHRAYLVGGFLGLAILSVGAGLQVLPVAASSGAASASTHAASSYAGPNLDRALKGDRLPDAAAPVGEARPLKAKQPRLPEGCEASVSSISHSPLAQTPADCLS